MPDLFDVPPKREKQLQERGGIKEEMADCYGPAHARRTDPGTSHEAAEAVTPHTDTIRADVERWALGRGADGFIDEELSKAFDAEDSSSYRTRRAELVVSGHIVDSGRRKLNSNLRQCIVWVHRNFRGQPTQTPERPLTLTERLEAHARQLDAVAKDFRSWGYIGAATICTDAAAAIREALAAKKKAEAG